MAQNAVECKCVMQARNQLGTPGGRRVFWEGLKFFNFFKLCPMVLTLEHFCSIFVTLTISSGLMNPVFKNKKNTLSFNCRSSQKLHWKYKSHWAVWALKKLLCTLISYDFWWKYKQTNIAKVSYMPELNYTQTKKFWPEEILMLYTANTTVEACAEWVTATWRLYPI